MSAAPSNPDLSSQAYARVEAERTTVVWIDGVPWGKDTPRHRLLMPMAMPHTLGEVDRTKVRQAMHQADALVALWTAAWDIGSPSEWWWICCDQPDYNMDGLSKQVRYNIRTGLKHCRVERLEAEWFARNGYPVYAAAVAEYPNKGWCQSADQFYQEVTHAARYAGRETWGAFVDDKLVAYISCILMDEAATLSWSKSDPVYRRHKPNNALTYVLTHHYLVERKLRYVTAGARVVQHPTHIQEFREAMGYRRVYGLLNVEMHPLLAAGVRVGLPRLGGWSLVRKVAPGVAMRLSGVGLLARIAKSCRGLPAAARP
jgi:hypothetical protein